MMNIACRQFELTTIIYTLKIQSSLKQIPHF